MGEKKQHRKKMNPEASMMSMPSSNGMPPSFDYQQYVEILQVTTEIVSCDFRKNSIGAVAH